MKRLLLLTLALSLPLAQMVRADNDKDRRRHRREADRPSPEAAQPVRPAQRRMMPKQRTVQRQVIPSQRTTQRRQIPRQRTVPAVQRSAVKPEARLEGRNRQGTVNRNRPHRDFNRNSFSVARNRVIRVPHDRNWWRHHYNTTFVLFGGGYYYWWDGWWYPAYGYSPIYNNYIYSEPIYAPNSVAPGEVIENVQIALRDQGYYPGAIDGIVGVQTREALAAYQRDHGLVVTEAIDEPTLVTLGLA
jgi:hypothetical protein